MFFIYSILYTIALLVLFLPHYLKRPSALRRRWLREKFGRFGSVNEIIGKSPVWIHAVSVGEVNAAIPFIRRFRETFPSVPVILSTITDTGQEVARKKAPDNTHIVYLPFDLGFILRRCFSRVRPRLLIIMETELWPNMFRTADEMGVPVILLNGRISLKSSSGYRKASFFMKKVFRHVTLFCMQGSEDAERIKMAGAESGRVTVLGNFKFDMEISQNIPEWMGRIKGPVIVAGSTHEGEEQLIIDAYRENVYLFPGLKLIIAPRHPERFAEAEDVIRRSDIRYIRRSEIREEGGSSEELKFSIMLLDTIGELTSLYSVSDLAIMGKSFEGFGGQNPLEPAFWGKPIICGPHMENFPFISEFYSEGAAFEVTSLGLAKKIKELLMQPGKAATAGSRARALYLRKSGSVERAIKIVGGLVGR